MTSPNVQRMGASSSNSPIDPLFALLGNFLGRLLGRLLTHSFHSLDIPHLNPLLLRRPLALQFPFPPPPPMPKPLLPRPKSLGPQLRRLHQPSNAPVILAVAIVRSELQ